MTIGGSGFGWHDMDALFRPNAIGSYSFVGDNEIRFNKFDRGQFALNHATKAT